MCRECLLARVPTSSTTHNPGYQEFLRVVLDPGDEEHESMLEWVGGKFDPQEFDMGEANERLKRLRPRGRMKVAGR